MDASASGWFGEEATRAEPSRKQNSGEDALLGHLVCAALLHADTYEEVDADPSAIWQAGLIVLLTSLWIGVRSFSNGGIGGILWTTGIMLLSWILWACVS